jgi:2-keto-4-pentenoate hydratase/2-oxohepta-3-ene-1,7-dioic acid hydratase in catechol pathway
MKLLSYRKGSEVRTGILIGEGIIDLNRACLEFMELRGEDEDFLERYCSAILPKDMLSLLQAGERALNLIKDILRYKEVLEVLTPLESVKLTSPLPRANTFRDFLAFRGHVEASFKRRGMVVPPEWYKRPVYYKGDPRIFVGHNEDIPWPKYSNHLDLELEIAAITYKKGKDLKGEEAKEYIIGYTILNDFSARDVQMEEMKCLLGPSKGKDFVKSLGPYIVTRDEINNILGLNVKAEVNGEVWCDTKIKDMQWSFEEMISYVSQDEFIRPGDVFGSGTITGCTGIDIGRSLRNGDIIDLYVEGIGVLRNKVVRL